MCEEHSLSWESIKNVYILPICILNDTNKVKVIKMLINSDT